MKVNNANFMGQGHLNIGSCSEDVDVSLWLPEMGGHNVTMFCDRLIEKQSKPEGFILLVTQKGDINCLSVLNIEDQSSGFEIYRQYSDEEHDCLVMKVNAQRVKDELKIPKNCWSGFIWGNGFGGIFSLPRGVPTSKYNCRYILNFSVSGEFNLEVYYVPASGEEPVCLLDKSFCCK